MKKKKKATIIKKSSKSGFSGVYFHKNMKGKGLRKSTIESLIKDHPDERPLFFQIKPTLSVRLFFWGGYTIVLSYWDFAQGKVRLLYQGKASCDRVMLPNLWYMLGVLVFP